MRVLFALLLASAPLVAPHPPNVTCLPGPGGWTSVVGMYHTHGCKLGAGAREWAWFPCPKCMYGCLECQDGNLVALTWQCKPQQREGQVIHVTGTAETMYANGTAIGQMFTHCVSSTHLAMV